MGPAEGAGEKAASGRTGTRTTAAAMGQAMGEAEVEAEGQGGDEVRGVPARRHGVRQHGDRHRFRIRRESGCQSPKGRDRHE